MPAAKPRTAWRDWPEQRRRLEDHLQQTQKTEIIGRLATGIAHDFNIILMAILNNADLLALRTATDDPRHRSIEEIRDAVTRGTV
jgi:two-component system cell cycle sensor histidine kinase/response regulator CckA